MAAIREVDNAMGLPTPGIDRWKHRTCFVLGSQYVLLRSLGPLSNPAKLFWSACSARRQLHPCAGIRNVLQRRTFPRRTVPRSIQTGSATET